MSYPDAIIDEVRAARDAIAKAFDYDITRIAHAIQARQAQNGRPVVRLPPRRIAVEPHAADPSAEAVAVDERR